LPSEKIDPASISHLSRDQQLELFDTASVFQMYQVILTPIQLTDDFKPKRLLAYRVPEKLKPEVDRQIQGMLRIISKPYG